MTAIDRLHQAEAAAREALAAADASLQGDADAKTMMDAHYEACGGCADALRNLLAALDAARGEAVYFTALPSGEYIQTKDDSLKEKGYRVVTAYLAPQAPPATSNAWEPSNKDYDRSIHSNPDAKAWADLFVDTFPGLADKHDQMLGWFANAMMAMHDSIKQKQAPPAAPRVERYGDGVLVHWAEGVEQYVCVGDCVTGNLGAMAVPDGWTQAAEWLRNNYQDHPNIASLYRAMLSTANKENDNEHC